MPLEVKGGQRADIPHARHMHAEVPHKGQNCRRALWQREVQDKGRQYNARQLPQEQQRLHSGAKFSFDLPVRLSDIKM